MLKKLQVCEGVNKRICISFIFSNFLNVFQASAVTRATKLNDIERGITAYTSWKGTTNDITKMAVDKDDPYFASLLAAYIISHVGGISRKHLTGDNNVITSIARYYVYYHMKRFTETPEKMMPYITDDIRKIIQKKYTVKTYLDP